jgi:hypothetical protein
MDTWLAATDEIVARALCHEALGLGWDHLILLSVQVPRRQRFPRQILLLFTTFLSTL